MAQTLEGHRGVCTRCIIPAWFLWLSGALGNRWSKQQSSTAPAIMEIWGKDKEMKIFSQTLWDFPYWALRSKRLPILARAHNRTTQLSQDLLKFPRSGLGSHSQRSRSWTFSLWVLGLSRVVIWLPIGILWWDLGNKKPPNEGHTRLWFLRKQNP